MSTSNQITRIQMARNTIRSKMVELGLATTTAKIDALATAVEGIENKGAVNAQVQEGETYTIPKGYHNGAGVVAGVSGGGNYNLQEKSITPTKSQQEVTPDSGYYGLSGVTVAAIPSNYNDTDAVTAGAADVLSGKVIIDKYGDTIAGTMVNNGTISKMLEIGTEAYTIPKGYHSGSGTVSISTERKTVTPTKAIQTITPEDGKVLSQVTVEAIPYAYQDVSGVTATAGTVLDGKVFVNAAGVQITGSMANNGDVSATIDGLSETSVAIPAGYTTGGTVSLSDDIEEALSGI